MSLDFAQVLLLTCRENKDLLWPFRTTKTQPINSLNSKSVLRLHCKSGYKSENKIMKFKSTFMICVIHLQCISCILSKEPKNSKVHSLSILFRKSMVENWGENMRLSIQCHSFSVRAQEELHDHVTWGDDLQPSQPLLLHLNKKHSSS